MLYYISIGCKYQCGKVEIMKKTTEEKNPRLGQVGGQALLEGVMMRCGETVATSVRAMDGSIKAKRTKFVSARKKYKICGLPLIRGVVSFVESMIMSLSTMNDAVNMLGIEEEESKFEKWLKKKFGKNIFDPLREKQNNRRGNDSCNMAADKKNISPKRKFSVDRTQPDQRIGKERHQPEQVSQHLTQDVLSLSGAELFHFYISSQSKNEVIDSAMPSRATKIHSALRLMKSNAFLPIEACSAEVAKPEV